MNLILKIQETEKAGKIPAFAYDRVSTSKQENDGMSLEYQARQALKYAADNNLEIIQVYSSAESAFKEGRKNFNRMLDDAVKHGVKDIIVKNTDRLSRNELDWSRCKKLAREKGLRLHLYELGTIFKVDSSAEEEVFLDNTAVFAKYWSNKISQSVRNAHADKRARGVRSGGRPPLGYIYNKSDQTYSIDPDKKEIIDFIFTEYDDNRISIDTLAEKLNHNGYRTSTGKLWRRPNLHTILKNPFYAGKFETRGEVFDGVQEPYISWDRYLSRLDRMGERWCGTRQREFDYLLANMLISDTGFIFTGETKKGKYNYYSRRGEKQRIYLKEDDIFSMIDKQIERIKYTDSFAEDLKNVFKDLVNEAVDTHTSILKSINKKIADLQGKQNKVIDLFTSDDIPLEPLKRKIKEIDAEIKALEQQREKASAIRMETYYEIAEVIDSIRNFTGFYLSRGKEIKAEYLRTMAERVIITEKDVQIVWKRPFCWIIEDSVRLGTIIRADQDECRTICLEILLRFAA